MSEAFRIRDIEPNPFRHMDRYPIRKEKIAMLRESLRTTGFWDNVVARIGDNGRPQIAYGHHRLHALREEYAPTHKVNLIIRDLDDDQMLRIMARENMEEWGTSAAVEQETVRAVVEAYAEGRIQLPKLSRNVSKDQIRYAPGFIQGDVSAGGRTVPYTARQVANYLGWDEDKVGYALGALELIDEGLLTEKDFDGLGTKAARRVVEEARKAKRDSEVREREQRRAAEAARKAAEKAARERDRAKAQAERDRQAKREEKAREAAAAAKRAEQERARQEKAQRKAQERAEDQREAARQKGRAAGKQASERIKTGQKGYAAKDLVDKPKGKGKDLPPPDIDDYAYKLAARLNKVMDIDFDVRARELDRVITFRKYLSPRAARELDVVLGRIIERIVVVRKKLGVDPRVEDDGVIDAEVVETQEVTG